jgi:hypothetical protein
MLAKSSAGYVFFTEDPSYRCGSCQFRKQEGAKLRCLFFGPLVLISGEHGSCNDYKYGNPVTDEYFAPFLTKENLGYTENRLGFGCRRCSEFIVGKDDCETVDRKGGGFTPGRIDPLACCNFWRPDAVRAKLTDDQLIKITSAPRVVLRLAR